jgi:hypothetical protein
MQHIGWALVAACLKALTLLQSTYAKAAAEVTAPLRGSQQLAMSAVGSHLADGLLGQGCCIGPRGGQAQQHEIPLRCLPGWQSGSPAANRFTSADA